MTEGPSTPASDPNSSPRRGALAWLASCLPTALPRDAPWSVGAAFGAAHLVVFLLAHAGMIAIGARSGHLHELNLDHALWIAPTLAIDLGVALGVALPFGALLRFLPRLRPVILTLAYLKLLFASLVCMVSVPTYGALHATLHVTQLLLAGGVRDIWDSGVDIVSPAGAVAAFALLLACLALPPKLVATARRLGALPRARRAQLTAAGIAVATGIAFWLAPSGGASGLETNPLAEFALSVVRYGTRTRHDIDVDMTGAPHFDSSPLMKPSARPEALDKLVDPAKLPLKRPNVVLFVLESAAVNQLPLWRGKHPTTPRMTELAQHGLRFDDYYAASPVSMKSLFSLHCASYPYPHPAAETYVNPSMDCRSISEILKEQGYRTGLFHGGRFAYTRKDEFFKYRKYDVMRDAEKLVHRTRYAKLPWGSDDRAVIDDAIAWLNEKKDAPFFLDVIFLAPHHPYALRNAPEPFGTKTDLDRYRNATLLIDSQIGRVWDWLVANGKQENTLVVIVGDHGEAFGEHPGNFTHGTRIYEESVRTPLMLVNPQLFHGARTSRVGNHVDLVPTLLDVMGLRVEPRHQGRSLLRGYRPHTIYFYADWYRHLLGLRDGPWKYIYDLDGERDELYDLEEDRDEKRNVASLHGKQLERYKDRVLRWESFYRELIPSYDHYATGGGMCPGRPTCYLDEVKPQLQKGDMRRKRSFGGDKLRVGKRTSEHGLGVQPLSILRYDLRNEDFVTLKGAVGHHVQGRNANLSLKVSAEIYLDDKLIWSSGKLAADEEPRTFELDVKGGSVLELIGYDVDGETWRDYMDWLDVRLER